MILLKGSQNDTKAQCEKVCTCSLLATIGCRALENQGFSAIQTLISITQEIITRLSNRKTRTHSQITYVWKTPDKFQPLESSGVIFYVLLSCKVRDLVFKPRPVILLLVLQSYQGSV